MSREPERTTTARASTAITQRLAPDHQAWLKEFSVVMHRRYAYPPGHPSRVAAEEVAMDALSRVLEQHLEIVIAVTRRQLSVDGGFSDLRNPALSELAERLHRQGIGTITLRAGITPGEFDTLLTRIVRASPRHEDEPPDDDAPPWAHVVIERLTYEGLALSDEAAGDDDRGPDATGDRLWRELAELAVAGWDGTDGFGSSGGGSGPKDDAHAPSRQAADSPPIVDAPPQRRSSTQFALTSTGEFQTSTTADQLARIVNQRATDPRFAAEMMKSILRVGRHARRRGRAGTGAVAARLRDVLQRLEPGAIRSLIESEADPKRRQLLVLQGVDALPLSSVLDWIEAASKSADKSISHHLLRLLTKLSAQARRRRDNGPDEGGEALRSAARQLIEGWTLEADANTEHTSLLEKLSAYDQAERSLDGGEAAGADIIVQIALETDAVGSDLLAAVDHLIGTKRLAALIGFLDRIPSSLVAAPAVRDHLIAADTLRRILLTEPVEVEGARLILASCGAAQADSLLDALAIAEGKETCLLILHRLRELGDAVCSPVLARLDNSPWQVQRNLLSLLATMPALPADLRVGSFAKHDEAMVRVEALRVAVRLPGQRDAAIHEALLDHDLHVLRAALDAAAHDGVPRHSALRLLQCLEKADPGSDIRLRGIPLLGQVPLTAARDWLVQLAVPKRRLFRRLALRPKSAELLSALRVLSAHWANDGSAAVVFRLAARSGDVEVRDAARVAAR